MLHKDNLSTTTVEITLGEYRSQSIHSAALLYENESTGKLFNAYVIIPSIYLTPVT
jgi:hypothetical protein